MTADAALSWNMQCAAVVRTDAPTRRRRLNLLVEMLAEFSPSLVALQEVPEEAELKAVLPSRYQVTMTSKRVASIHDTKRWSCDSEDIENGNIVVTGLRSVAGKQDNLWMMNIHAPVLHVHSEKVREFFARTARHLEKFREVDARLELVLGDMNVPPFHEGIMRATGLRGSRCHSWTVNQEGLDRPLFNATWQILGRHADASGTFYRSSIDMDGPWYAIDQILMSPELAGAGHLFTIVDKVGIKKLRKNGRVGAPDQRVGSDHLPVLAYITTK